MQPATIARKDLDKFISAVPTPYEYALISRLAYQDVSTLSAAKHSEDHQYYEHLKSKGWTLLDTRKDNDYYGYVWVNENTQQIVIAHRGSQNATSWITDIESVVQLKPGTFISAAINLLSHPKVLEYRQKGYRLSSTGHSLGGFLAQVCVFWLQRREFEQTFYPNISAITFDSPGVVDFLKVIRSNLKSESQSIKLEYLNMHNFCAMPTLVSTYGTQTGTLWHLPGAENVSFAFVNDHRMAHMLKGFNAETGYPIHFRQMTDWPQADYSAYEGFTSAVEHVAVEAAKAPFNFLNYLYKKLIKRNTVDTWYDQLFRREGAVETFLKSQSYRPSLGAFKDQLVLAIKSHYTSFPSEAASRTHLGLHHFDQPVQTFLSDFFIAKQFGLDTLGLDAQLKSLVGQEGFKLLHQFMLEKYGDRIEMNLSSDYSGSVFDFQREMLILLKRSNVPSIRQLISSKVEEFKKNLATLTTKQSEELKTLQDKVDKLEKAEQVIKYSRLITRRCAVAKVPGSTALRFLELIDYQPARMDELDFVFKNAKPGDEVYLDGALAMQPGSHAVVASPGQSAEKIAELFKSLGVFRNTSKTSSSTKQNDDSILEQRGDNTSKNIVAGVHARDDVSDADKRSSLYFQTAVANTSGAVAIHVGKLVVGKEKKETLEFPIHYTPFERNRDFTGRVELLKQIKDSFQKQSVNTIIAAKEVNIKQVLVGLAGVGKTQLAIEYIYQSREEYQLIYWLDAERDLPNQFRELAKDHLKLQVENVRNEGIIQKIHEVLLHIQRWLLVFDNVSNPNDIVPYTPKFLSDKQHILITSRKQHWPSISPIV